MDNIQNAVKRTQKEFNKFNMKRYLTALAIKVAERNVNMHIFPIGKKGTSYTDGKNIWLTLWEDFILKSFKIQKICMEGFAAHEAEHCRSSNFKDGKRCAELVGEFFHKKYGYKKKAGENLGASLYNIIEDGRIERITMNRYPGLVISFKYINAIIYKKNELDINEKRNVYKDFMSAILCLAKTGMKPKNWDVLYLKQIQDGLLNKIAFIIYDATCSNFTEDVVQAVIKVVEIIDPWIHEAIEKNSELIEQLEKMAQDMSQAENSAEQQQQNASNNPGQGQPGQGISINKPQGIPGNQGNGSGNESEGESDSSSDNSKNHSNGKGAGVGNQSGATTAQDALAGAEEIDKTIDDLEKAIEEDEQNNKEIKEQQEQAELERKNSSDKEITQQELDSLEENNTGLNFGNATIEHFQQALEESEVFDISDDIRRDGDAIYNKLKPLFMKRRDVIIRNRKRGRLDVSRLPSMLAISNAGEFEDRIFSKTKNSVKVSCALGVINDVSGSTGGTIYKNELEACAKIEEGFGKLLPMKIAAYDSDYNFRYRVIRDFNNKSTNINLSYNFLKHQSPGGGTPTGEAMALMGYELLKRPEKNKLLIVITDGSPDNNEKVRLQCKKLRKEGIKVIAILVSDSYDSYLVDSFNEMYEKQDIITKKPEEISSCLISLVSKWITSSAFK